MLIYDACQIPTSSNTISYQFKQEHIEGKHTSTSTRNWHREREREKEKEKERETKREINNTQWHNFEVDDVSLCIGCVTIITM